MAERMAAKDTTGPEEDKPGLLLENYRHRSRVENSAQVAEAEWRQGFRDYHCPEAVRMLASALGRLGKLCRVKEPPQPKRGNTHI